jgi:TnpA family transposase
MQRLANAPAADRLANALRQLGRLIKTIHILRYIHEEKLSRVMPVEGRGVGSRQTQQAARGREIG